MFTPESSFVHTLQTWGILQPSSSPLGCCGGPRVLSPGQPGAAGLLVVSLRPGAGGTRGSAARWGNGSHGMMGHMVG